MKTTWSDILDETKRLGFCSQEDFSHDYSGDALICAANSALADLAELCPIKKSCDIVFAPDENLINASNAELFSVHRHTAADTAFTAKAPVAYCFEYSGNAEVRFEKVINGESTELFTVTPDYARGFEICRGFIEADGAEVKMIFTGDYSYSFRNIAMYGTAPSDNSDDIQPFSEYLRYDIAEIDDSFMRFDAKHPVCKAVGKSRFSSVCEYAFDGDSTILFPRECTGQITVYYDAYPQKLTATTPPSHIIEMSAGAAKLIPLFIASRIYLDDLPDKAVSYFNEYTHLRQSLYNGLQPDSVWSCLSGWF